MGKRERTQVAYAVLELQDAQDELRAADVEKLPTRGFELQELLCLQARALAEALALVRDATVRLSEGTSASVGLPVSEAARYLGVSEPTVRSWIQRGLLVEVAGSKPKLLESASLRRVKRAITELRARGQDRDWLASLVDLLHDRAEVQRTEIRQGLEELARGELEPA